MKRLVSSAFLAACAVVLTAGPSAAQDKQPPRARVSIYRVAPGKQLEFLKWIAAQDEAAKEAGVAATQIYSHTDGDSWDYLGIAPTTTPEQDKKVDEIAKKKGLKTGFAASLEFRQFVAGHTDTFTIGPLTAAEMVAMAAK
jgi:hypothetical protein